MKRIRIWVLVAAILGVGSYIVGNAEGAKPKSVTFARDVAPILFNQCATCHRPGELAPMSLLSYKDARPWARSIKEKVVAREMPPWHADDQYGDFINKRTLSQQEIDTIVAWVDQGAPEGDPRRLPEPPRFTQGWRIGKPDLVLPMAEEYTLAAEGPDEYKYFEIATDFKEDVWVQTAEARPGNPKIVHHIIAFVVPPKPKTTGKNPFALPPKVVQEIQKRVIFYQDGSLIRVKPETPVYDDGCSTPEGGAGLFPDGTGRDNFGMLLCGQAPGRDVDSWPVGMAKKIPAGSKLVLQVHYARTGKVEKDRSSVGLIIAKTPPEQTVLTRPIQNNYFKIPPGADNHRVTSCFTFQEDARLLALMPHMHLRGKDMTIRAHYPDGRTETLLSVPRYSFAWQTTYYLRKPVAIPKGARIECIAHFDNSARNKHNPDATKPVRFGDPTYDEMMIGWIDYTLDSQRTGKPEITTASSK